MSAFCLQPTFPSNVAIASRRKAYVYWQCTLLLFVFLRIHNRSLPTPFLWRPQTSLLNPTDIVAPTHQELEGKCQGVSHHQNNLAIVLPHHYTPGWPLQHQYTYARSLLRRYYKQGDGKGILPSVPSTRRRSSRVSSVQGCFLLSHAAAEADQSVGRSSYAMNTHTSIVINGCSHRRLPCNSKQEE